MVLMYQLLFLLFLSPQFGFSQEIPVEWQHCEQNSDCKVWHEDCGGIPYNLSFFEKISAKLSNDFSCKQLIPELKFVAFCDQGKC
jgi:hypothetical protein